jgi:hypothetical protein
LDSSSTAIPVLSLFWVLSADSISTDEITDPFFIN